MTCFCSSSHFTSLKHFIMQTLPFPLTAQEPPMPGFAPVLLATCLQSLFQPLFTFLDSFQLCLSPFSLPVLMSGSQEDIRIIWEIFLTIHTLCQDPGCSHTSHTLLGSRSRKKYVTTTRIPSEFNQIDICKERNHLSFSFQKVIPLSLPPPK